MSCLVVQENLCFWVNLGQCTSSQSPSSSTAFVLAQISIVPPKVLFSSFPGPMSVSAPLFLLLSTYLSNPPQFGCMEIFLLGERNKGGLDTDELDCMYDLSMDKHFVWYYCRRLRMKNQNSSTHTWASKSPILGQPPPPPSVHVWFYLRYSGRVAHLTRDTPFASPNSLICQYSSSGTVSLPRNRACVPFSVRST